MYSENVQGLILTDPLWEIWIDKKGFRVMYGEILSCLEKFARTRLWKRNMYYILYINVLLNVYMYIWIRNIDKYWSLACLFVKTKCLVKLALSKPQLVKMYKEC